MLNTGRIGLSGPAAETNDAMDNTDRLPRHLVSRRRLLSGAALTAAGLAAARPSAAGAAVYSRGPA